MYPDGIRPLITCRDTLKGSHGEPAAVSVSCARRRDDGGYGGLGVMTVIAAIRRVLGMQRGQLPGRYTPHLYYM